MNAANSMIVMRDADARAAAVAEARELDALFVLNSLNVGGSETKTIRVVNGLRRRGVRAGIAYLNEPEQLLASLDAQIPAWNLGRRGKLSTAAIRRLRKVVQQTMPACVLEPVVESAAPSFGQTSVPPG